MKPKYVELLEKLDELVEQKTAIIFCRFEELSKEQLEELIQKYKTNSQEIDALLRQLRYSVIKKALTDYYSGELIYSVSIERNGIRFGAMSPYDEDKVLIPFDVFEKFIAFLKEMEVVR